MADLTYTVPEAAKALGCGKNRVYDLIASGNIPAVRFGRLILIPKSSLDRWLEEQAQRNEHAVR